MADHYNNGRVFLAGDAVHLFSPTGGFGMNTGVSDVMDLAWKLEAALCGWAGPRLLDSYEKERRPVGIRNTREAADCFDRLFAVMQEGDVLDEESPTGDEARRHLKKLIVRQEKLIVSSGTLLGYRYEGSDIIVPDATPEPTDHPRIYIPTARPGHRTPHVWLQDGRSILDLFINGFTLLVMVQADCNQNGAIGEFTKAAEDIGMPLSIAVVEDHAAHRMYEAPLTLIRPDLMVAWRGTQYEGNVANILNIVRGA